MMIVGNIEKWLYDKAMEAWNEDTVIGKVKFVIYSFVSGFPAGLCYDGILLILLGIIGKITKKKLVFVDK